MALLLLGLSAWTFFLVVRPSDPASLGLEYTQPMKMVLTVNAARGQTLIEIDTQTKEHIHLSVPSSWKRHEVRHVPIATVIEEGSDFGFVRWRLPPRTWISFLASSLPEHLTLFTPSRVPLNLDLLRIDLDRNTTSRRTMLVQSDTPSLW